MAIISSIDLTDSLRVVEVDVDPAIELPDVPEGSLVVYKGVLTRIAYGSSSSSTTPDLSYHADRHEADAEDPIPTLPTAAQKAAMNNAAPEGSGSNPFVTERNQGGLFGTFYEYASSDEESMTTSNIYTPKLVYTTSVLAVGRYRTEWSAEVTQSTNNKAMSVRARVDASPTNEMEHYTSGQQIWEGVGGFYSFEIPAPTAVTMDIYYRRISLPGQAMIRRARMHIWRVG